MSQSGRVGSDRDGGSLLTTTYKTVIGAKRLIP
jgi:hypothetical protein